MAKSLILEPPKKKRKITLEPYVPTENEAQKIVVKWAWGDSKTFGANAKWPELNWLYMVPNGAMLGGYNRHRTYNHLRAMGLNPGVPDFVLPAAHAGKFGAYAEGKRSEKKDLGEKQQKWRDYLIATGYFWFRWDSAQECIDQLTWYVKQSRTVAAPLSIFTEAATIIAHLRKNIPRGWIVDWEDRIDAFLAKVETKEEE